MTDKLREKLAKWLYKSEHPKGWFFNSWEQLAVNDPSKQESYRSKAVGLLALIQESGWVSPEEHKRLANIAHAAGKADGYREGTERG